jgi:hypothetical protein
VSYGGTMLYCTGFKRIGTLPYRDRYEVLIERRAVLYSIGTIKSWVRDFWYAMAKGKLPPLPARVAPLLPPEAVVAMWVRRWQQRLSVWLHLTLSRQVLRYLAPSVAGGVRFFKTACVAVSVIL